MGLKKKILYVFGNEYLKNDSFAKKISKIIANKIKVVLCTAPEILLESNEKEIIILDVIKNIKKIIIITDISKIKTSKIISLHDFDLGFFLKLMKEMKINKKIKIIGIPCKGNAAKIAKEVEKCI